MISGAPRITLMASLIRLRELSPEREERRERRRMKEREREMDPSGLQSKFSTTLSG